MSLGQHRGVACVCLTISGPLAQKTRGLGVIQGFIHQRRPPQSTHMVGAGGMSAGTPAGPLRPATCPGPSHIRVTGPRPETSRTSCLPSAACLAQAEPGLGQGRVGHYSGHTDPFSMFLNAPQDSFCMAFYSFLLGTPFSNGKEVRLPCLLNPYEASPSPPSSLPGDPPTAGIQDPHGLQLP